MKTILPLIAFGVLMSCTEQPYQHPEDCTCNECNLAPLELISVCGDDSKD